MTLLDRTFRNVLLPMAGVPLTMVLRPEAVSGGLMAVGVLMLLFLAAYAAVAIKEL